jgi:transcriptional regulator with XRE-family HTH domain
MTKTLVEEFVANPENMRLFQQERAIYEVTEVLEALMSELGVSRSELARRLGKTKGWVTQLLDGEANKTVRTVADAFAVLGYEYRSFHRPIQIGKKRSADAVGTGKKAGKKSLGRTVPGR